MTRWTIGAKWHSHKSIILKDGEEYASTNNQESAFEIIQAMQEWEAVQAREKEIKEIVQNHSKRCQERFQRENPCPKCGSHNTDIDWGTPMFCRDCGYEWEKELREMKTR